jgi:16S rRNA (guanine966-N2)-methyltransferase
VRDRALDLISEDLEGARFLDLFAGSGAVGLEALSRGARFADFVENGPAALHALKANVAALREGRRCRIFKKDVLPWIRSLEPGRYDVAYVDAPYGSRKVDRVIERWREVPFATTLVVEHKKEHDLGVKGRRFDFEGPTRITILST